MATLYQFPYRTVAEISLTSLLKNLVTIRSACRKEIVPIVKADAYGHGMLPIAKALVSRGSCHTLAVATLEEAIELRKKIPYAISIIVLSGYWPHQAEAFVKFRLVPIIHSLNHLKSLQLRKTVPDIHLKVDTGMNRLGIRMEELPEAIQVLKKMGVKLSGLGTHFAESDKSTSSFTDDQIKCFQIAYSELQMQKLLHTDAKIHVANSSAIFRGKLGPSVAVRPGLSLFGISPNPHLKGSGDLIPILSWKARVVTSKPIKKGESVGYGRTYRAKKTERISIVSIGYADGYPRSLSNVGMVLLHGKKVPVRGRVSMDLIAVDSTGLDVRDGSSVTLIGSDNRHEISAWDMAVWADTIPYEILCGISGRVPRIYLD
ncbi:MAG: alanine racemase [Proteobacteria bacterium]|nr:alanine racemase [Pseudomonadota bacterium]